MSDIAYGDWFNFLASKTGSAEATCQLFRCLSVPEDGSGLLLVLAFAVKAIEQSARKDLSYQVWIAHLKLLYATTENLVSRFVTLSKPTARELKRETWGPICSLAEIGHRKLHPSVLEVTGWLLVDALRSNEQLTAKTADQLLTLQRDGDRAVPDREWSAIRAAIPLTKSAIEAVILTDGNSEAISLAKKIKQAAFTNINAPHFGIANSPTVPSITNDGKSAEIEKEGRPTTPRRGKQAREIAPPSAAKLKARASYRPPLSAFGLAETCDRLTPVRLQKTVAAMAADLTLMGSTDRPAMAAISIISLYINHSTASTLKLSLTSNDDLWLEKDGHLYFNRKKFLGLKGSPATQDILRITLPNKIRKFLIVRLKENPDAISLAELLKIGDEAAWHSKIEYYLTCHGDSAHKSTPGRFVHSLAFVYLHLGASEEVAAFDTLSPELVGDSTLNYIRLKYSDLQQIRRDVAKFLELGDIDAEEAVPEWVGSSRCPSDDQFNQDWKLQSDTCAASIVKIKGAANVADVVAAFNKASSSNSRALRATTGGRMQLTAHPTRRDLLSQESYIYTYDKKTQPNSSRLTPRTKEMDGVIAAQQLLTKVTVRRLQHLGIDNAKLPILLADPSCYGAFFVELMVVPAREGNSDIKINARAITLSTVEANVVKPFNLAANSARHYWGSKCAAKAGSTWLERAILGHGRKLAVVGSWCTSTPPSLLLQKAASFMQETLDQLGLDTYAGITNPRIVLLSPCLHMKGTDKRKEKTGCLNPDMPTHYCNETTLPAMAVVDSLRDSLTRADADNAASKVLISIVVSDGISSGQDVVDIWKDLERNVARQGVLNFNWTRASGQEIELPTQPSTRVHLGRLEHLPKLDDVVQDVKQMLHVKFPNIAWPDSTKGILKAMCWLMCRWLRVNVSPILLYCYDASTTAATFSKKSISRLLLKEQKSFTSLQSIETFAHRKSHSCGFDAALSELSPTVWRIADGDKKLGGEIRRSELLKKAFDERFDDSNCHPAVEMILQWLHSETSAWINKETDVIEVAVMYEYMTRIFHRLKSYPNFNATTTDWTQKDWQAFVAWILNVDDYLASQREGVHRNRVVALRRILVGLRNGGHFRIPADVIPDFKVDPCRAWCESASRVFVSAGARHEVQLCIDQIYKDWEIPRYQMRTLHDLMISGCMRSNEANALMTSHISGDLAMLTNCGFSQIKTDGSQRPADLGEKLSEQLTHLLQLLSQLPEPPRMLLSQDFSKINLSIGRAMQSVLVDLYRHVLNDPGFVIHTLRGTGLQLKVLPSGESLIREIFYDGYFSLGESVKLRDALCGKDPRHLGRCFVQSGHASHRTPAESYLSAWPFWYSASLRATQVGQRLHSTLANMLPDRDYQMLRTERSRFGDPHIDEWRWALEPPRRKRKPTAVPIDTAHVNLSSAASSVAVVDPLVRFKYGVFRLLELKKPAAEHAAKLGRSHADIVDSRLKFAKSFHQLHKRTPGRVDTQGRPRRSSVKYSNSDISDAILPFIHSSSQQSAQALEDLLTNECTYLTQNDVVQAIAALPIDFKIQICWPRGQIDTAIVLKLNALPRVVGLSERKHIAHGIRVRVIPPGSDPSEFSITHTTTMTRAALLVRKLLLPNIGKENS